METRILENGKCTITGGYNKDHLAVDLVGEKLALDYVLAHSDGKIIFYQDGYDNLKGSIGNISYGNCIKIDHGNGYYTLYAHLKKNLLVKSGQHVKKGQRIGYMSDSGNSYGAHLHFEVWKDKMRIDPIKYLNSDLDNNSLKHTIGEVVRIKNVYSSSTSDKALIPLITKGTITRIVNNVRNPYLLNNGDIGWVNDDSIINDIVYLVNKEYSGNSIVDALKQINVDSSFSYRLRLANYNGISNYTGTGEQNIKMLEMLKNGSLIKV